MEIRIQGLHLTVKICHKMIARLVGNLCRPERKKFRPGAFGFLPSTVMLNADANNDNFKEPTPIQATPNATRTGTKERFIWVHGYNVFNLITIIIKSLSTLAPLLKLFEA